MKLNMSAEKYSSEEKNQILELYGWLQGKQLSVRQAIKLLNDTKSEISDACHTEVNKMLL